MEKLAGVCALIFFEIGLVLQSNFAFIFLGAEFFFLKRNEVELREQRASRGADETRLLCALELKGFQARGIVFRFLRHGFAR